MKLSINVSNLYQLNDLALEAETNGSEFIRSFCKTILINLIKKEKIIINIDQLNNLALEAETNGSEFIRSFCKTILIKIAKKSMKIITEIRKMNKVNPYGYIL